MRFSRISAIALSLVLSFLPVDVAGVIRSAAIAQTSPFQTERRERPMRMVALAIWMYDIGVPDSSLALAERGIKALQEMGDRAQEAQALVSIADTIRAEGQLQKSLPYYERALAIYGGSVISPVDRKMQLSQAGEVADAIAEIYQALGQYDRALATYEQALTFRRRSETEWISTLTFAQIGTLQQLLGRPEQALTSYQQAQALHEKTQDRFYETQLMNRLGALYQAQGQFDLALAAYQQGLTALEGRSAELPVFADRVLTLENIRDLYQAQGQTTQAASYGQQAVGALQEFVPYPGAAPHPFLQATLLQEIGNFYLKTRQYDRAKSYFDRAAAIAPESPDVYAHSNILGTIATAYQQFGLLEACLSYQQQQREAVQAIPGGGRSPTALLPEAELYQALGQWEAALTAYQQTLTNLQAATQRSSRESEIALVLLQIGKIYQAQGQTEQALTTYLQVLSANFTSLDPSGKVAQAEVLRQMGQLYEAQGQMEQAQQHYQKAEEIVSQLLVSSQI